METTSDKEIRERCRELILLYLRGSTEPVELRTLAPIYHGFYARNDRWARWQNLSNFLARMETAGLVRCTYHRDGTVSTIELQSSRSVTEEVAT